MDLGQLVFRSTGECFLFVYLFIHLSKCTCTLAATQTWCLARLLPLLIGEKIPEEDDHWDNFLLHLDYCFAPVTSTEMIAYLRVHT